jgi:bacillithiol system protein YtxJ
MIPAITSEAQLLTLLTGAGHHWLFKHSLTCSISLAAFDEVAGWLAAHPTMDLGLIAVQTHRPLSNLAAEHLKVVHQSPQIILLRDGSVQWQASHWSITAATLEAAAKAHGVTG